MNEVGNGKEAGTIPDTVTSLTQPDVGPDEVVKTMWHAELFTWCLSSDPLGPQ